MAHAVSILFGLSNFVKCNYYFIIPQRALENLTLFALPFGLVCVVAAKPKVPNAGGHRIIFLNVLTGKGFEFF